MAYGQINYQEKVGNGPYTIAQIGCFLTAFCNLAARFSITIDPPTLNNLFIQYNDYLADPEDGAGVKDDLSWHSITSAESGIVVTGEGGAGWPNTNNAIVKFEYPENGSTMTHFCLVADHNAQTIVDSWDGVTKTTGKYGQPVAWATYGGPVVQAVPAAQPAPTEPAAPSQGAYTVVKAIPGYGDANNAANHISPVDTVQPETYSIFNRADNMINVTKDAGVAGSWINPSDNQETPAAPAQPSVPEVAAPTPPAPQKPANTTYTKLSTPLDLITNKNPTHVWALNFVNDTEAVSNSTLAEGAAFLAYGIAQRTDGDKPAYYMTFADFGQADTTGVPTNNEGVNTVDLSTAPAPATPAAPAATPSTSAADADSEETKVNVTVIPSSFQSTYTAFLSPQEYTANANTTVNEIDAELPVSEAHPEAQELIKGQSVLVAGTFSQDGYKYYRTENSVKNGYWYGIPVISLTKVGSEPEEDTELGNLLEDIGKSEKAIVSTVNKTKGLFRRNKNKGVN
jgi:hypothetical protein